MNYILDYCKGCNQKRYIINKKHYLCQECNRKRLNPENKSKKTGEFEVFTQIWNERPQESFLTGEPLTHYKDTDLFPNLFAHVLPKGMNKFYKFKLYKKNIILLTPDEHFLLDQGSADQRRSYAEETGCDWNKIRELGIKLKEEYSTLYGTVLPYELLI